MEEISDKDIIDLIVEHNQPDKAMRLLLKKYQLRIYNHIRSILISHDDAHDVVQEVFVKAWLNIQNFRGESGLYTWIYRIATNESLNHIRKNKKHNLLKSESTEEYLVGLLVSEKQISGDEIQMKLQKAILKLPDQQRIVFNMRYFDNIKFKDIALIMSLSEGGVKSNYHFAEKKVREFLLHS